jgi:tetratricopeptide (TPR) repeat protein
VLAGLLLAATAAAIVLYAREGAERRREIERAIDHAALLLVEPEGTPGLDAAARALSALDPGTPLSCLVSDLAAGVAPRSTGEPEIDRLAESERVRLFGDVARARTLLEEAVRAEPDSAIAWALLCRLARHDPERRAIVGLVMEAAKEAPANAALQAGLGHLLALDSRNKEAAQAFARARAATSEPGRLPFHEACSLERAGRSAEALAVARAAGADCVVRLGRFLDSENRRPEAWALFREVLAGEPDRIDARFHLANSLSAAEEVKAAAAAFREILAREPSHTPALVSLAWLHAWVCGHERCAAVRDADQAMSLAAAAVRADGGRERAILITATRIARRRIARAAHVESRAISTELDRRGIGNDPEPR